MKRAAVYRGRRCWWVDVCDAADYRPGGPWQLRALATETGTTCGLPTHEEALRYALAEVGLTPTNPEPMEAP